MLRILLVSLFLFSSYTNNQDKITPLQLTVCPNEMKREFESLNNEALDLSEITSDYHCAKGGKKHCPNGKKVGAGRGYIYSGPTIRYDENEILIGKYKKSNVVSGMIVWANGKFFKGDFKNRKPSNGILVLSPQLFYKGDVKCINANNPCIPNGEGTMYRFSGGLEIVMSKGRWLDGDYLSDNITSTSNIHILHKNNFDGNNEVYNDLTERVKNAETLLETTLEEIADSEKNWNQELEKKRASWDRELESNRKGWKKTENEQKENLRLEIEAANKKLEKEKKAWEKNKRSQETELRSKLKAELSEREEKVSSREGVVGEREMLVQTQELELDNKVDRSERRLKELRLESENALKELWEEDVKKVKNLISFQSGNKNEKTIKGLLSNDEMRPDPREFNSLFYAKGFDKQKTYYDKLDNHLDKVNFNGYSLNNYFIKTISVGALNRSWIGAMSKKFDESILKDHKKFFIVVGFLNARTKETYNVYFYKVSEDSYKIIQIQL